MKPLLALLCFLTALLLTSCATHSTPAPFLQLARNGDTDYCIVPPADPSDVDRYAVEELQRYLQVMTTADFPLVEAKDWTWQPGRSAIFVGISPPALELLGQDPRPDLGEQEHVARSLGQNILLYGEGPHGNLYAVMNFLEESLGWRWFSVFQQPYLPDRSTAILAPFHRQQGVSFTYRKCSVRRGMDFFYQQGINQAYDSRIRITLGRNDHLTEDDFAPYRSLLPDSENGVHSLFRYISPTPDAHGASYLPWIEKKDTFATHPHYFSWWEDGERTPRRQLCFSSPEMRQLLTQRALDHIERLGGKALIDMGAMDTPGPFCYCPGCQAMEAEYQTPGGPIIDYLIELGEIVEQRFPEARVKCLAYRRSQTETPPVMPDGKKLPSTIVIDFAAIDDPYMADWSQPAVADSLANLRGWSEVTHHLWAWQYPNPWGTGMIMPVGNVQRLVTNLRLLHDAGVDGIFTDHNGSHQRAGWSELQAYLFLKLGMNIDADVDQLIREFTDYMYGDAAPLIRQYLEELEAGRLAIERYPQAMRYRSSNYDDLTFPYLTPENIHRWQGYFDEMVARTQDAPAYVQDNIGVVRRELDFATLWRWHKLRKLYPEHYNDYQQVVDRVNAVNNQKGVPLADWEEAAGRRIGRTPNPFGDDAMRDFVTIIKAGGEEKPLPPQFDGIDPQRIQTFVPQYSNRQPGRGMLIDPDAPFGFAVPVQKPDYPLHFGFYQADEKFRGALRKVTKEEIQPGVYNLYKLGEIDITPKCLIWFSNQSWTTNLELGERLYAPGEDNRWEAWVSLKFEGPTYGTPVNPKLASLADRQDYKPAEEGDLVVVGRIILVKMKP